MMVAAALAIGATAATPAFAQAGSALGACLKAHANTDDRRTLIRWIFTGMAKSAVVQDLSKITEGQRIEAMRGAGKVITRLISDCRSEAVASMKAYGDEEFEEAFGELGKLAVGDLMTDNEVGSTFAGVVQYLDMGALVKVMRESGSFEKKK